MGTVVGVSRDARHRFSKAPTREIVLRSGHGVEGDAHAGVTVQHRSRVRRDPTEPNLRQVHLIHCELFQELADAGFAIAPGQLGENITTEGVDLLGLSTGSLLHIGHDAVVRVTGLRNPCRQLDRLAGGLMRELVFVGAQGQTVRKAGVMGVVETGGAVRAGDPIRMLPPAGPHRPLEAV